MDSSQTSRRTCIVTGATSGIGQAIARRLAANFDVTAIGRNESALATLARELPGIHTLRADLTVDTDLELLRVQLAERPLHALVHCAGAHALGRIDATPVETLDGLYRANVRAFYLLAQACLPALRQTRGHLVVMNSSVAPGRPGAGLFAASQHALRAVTDALRAEQNEHGVRVVSIYPGRTATPRIAKLFADEQRAYDPAKLLQPDDIAKLVADVLATAATAELTDIHIRPAEKTY